MSKERVSTALLAVAKASLILLVVTAIGITVVLLVRGKSPKKNDFVKASVRLEVGMTKAEVIGIVPRPPDNTNARIVWYWLASPYSTTDLADDTRPKKWQELRFEPGYFLIFSEDGRLAIDSVQKSTEGTVREAAMQSLNGFRNPKYVDGLLSE